MKLFASLLALAAASAGAAPPAPLNLSRPFATRSPWRLEVSQGPDIADAFSHDGKAPGTIRLCVTRDGSRTCAPDLSRVLTLSTGSDAFDEPHYLDRTTIVRPSRRAPVLLLQVASLRGGNGDQRVATVALAYDRASDRFALAYSKQTRRNHNEEVRFVERGPLRGAIVSAEPTDDAPFGYWIAVNRLAAGRFQPVLRYRSATRYGDGNPLAVIDSEMPEMARRLGRWHPGRALPLPNRGCPRPHLIRRELWC